MLKQRLDLGREKEGVAGLRVVERLHTAAVPRQQEFAFPPVPEREGEHAVEAGKGVLSPLRQGLQHDLRVGVRAEAPAVPLQLPPQCAEVVDLAVVGEGETPVSALHGLGRGVTRDR